MQRNKAIALATSLLRNMGQDSCKLSAELILAHVLGCTRLELIIDNKKTLTERDLETFHALILRRSQGEPLAYILGEKEFYGLTFKVTANTLIPRPETELLVDLAINLLPTDKKIIFADFGTGSGNIGLSLLYSQHSWQGFLIDKSLQALNVAKENAHSLDLSQRVSFILASFIAPPIKAHSLDLIVANPPYIGLNEKDAVMPSVLAYEPKQALFSPNKGLYHLEACVRAGKSLLKEDSYLLVEHGANQGQLVRQIFKHYNFRNIRTENDLSTLERVTLGQK